MGVVAEGIAHMGVYGIRGTFLGSLLEGNPTISGLFSGPLFSETPIQVVPLFWEIPIP